MSYVDRVETEEGDYMFCFDNTFSTLSEKVIFFELILDNMGDEDDWEKYTTGTELLDMKLEDILVCYSHPLWNVWLLVLKMCLFSFSLNQNWIANREMWQLLHIYPS